MTGRIASKVQLANLTKWPSAIPAAIMNTKLVRSGAKTMSCHWLGRKFVARNGFLKQYTDSTVERANECHHTGIQDEGKPATVFTERTAREGHQAEHHQKSRFSRSM